MANIRKNCGGGARNPKCTPRGVNGMSPARITTKSEQAINHGLGRLLKGFARVRIIKMTKT